MLEQCARFTLPPMPLTVAFGYRLQLTEQRNVRQRGEKKRDRKRGTLIKFEPEIERNQSSVQLGYKLFPASICVATPSSKGFVLIWHSCPVCAYCVYSILGNLAKGGGTEVDETQCEVEYVTEVKKI